MIELRDYATTPGASWETMPEEVRANAIELLSKVNALLAVIDLPEARTPKVNSGWRPKSYNDMVPGAAPNSKHITGQAIDIADPDGALDDFLMDRTYLLARFGLYMEAPAFTKSWTHLQSVAPRSERLVFNP